MPASGSSAGSQTTQAAGSGTATLWWTPPLYNSDGSILTDLAGYHIFYGTDPDNLNQVVDLSGAGNVVFTVSNLAAGTWYFEISSYSAAGAESSPSAMVNTTIS